jgi:hypothetical protein
MLLRITAFITYVSSLVILLKTGLTLPLAAYIVYSHTLVYIALCALHQHLPMGPGVQEMWIGKKAIIVSLFLLLLLAFGGLYYPGFNLTTFAYSLPFGIGLGWLAYNIFGTRHAPTVS